MAKGQVPEGTLNSVRQREPCWCTLDLRHRPDAEMLDDYEWHWVHGFVQRVRIARHDASVQIEGGWQV